MAISRAPSPAASAADVRQRPGERGVRARVGEGPVPQLLGHGRGDLGELLVQLGRDSRSAVDSATIPRSAAGVNRRTSPDRASSPSQHGAAGPPPRRPAVRPARAGGRVGRCSRAAYPRVTADLLRQGDGTARAARARSRRQRGRPAEQRTAAHRPRRRAPGPARDAAGLDVQPLGGVGRRGRAGRGGRSCRRRRAGVRRAARSPVGRSPVPAPGPTVATTATRPTSRRRA